MCIQTNPNNTREHSYTPHSTLIHSEGGKRCVAPLLKAHYLGWSSNLHTYWHTHASRWTHACSHKDIPKKKKTPESEQNALCFVLFSRVFGIPGWPRMTVNLQPLSPKCWDFKRQQQKELEFTTSPILIPLPQSSSLPAIHYTAQVSFEHFSNPPASCLNIGVTGIKYHAQSSFSREIHTNYWIEKHLHESI